MNRRKCLQTVHFFHGFVNHVSSRICNDYGWVFPWIWLNFLVQILNPKSTWDNNHHYFNLWYLCIKLKKLFKNWINFSSFWENAKFCQKWWLLYQFDSGLKSLTSEATPSATQFVKRSYKISHPPGLWLS